jgi:hypothetical protein
MPKASRKRGPRARAEPWEVEHVHKEIPVKSREELADSIEECKGELPESEDRAKITNCVRKKLS